MEVVIVLRWRFNGKRFYFNDLVILMYILIGIKVKFLKFYLEGIFLVRLEFLVWVKVKIGEYFM